MSFIFSMLAIAAYTSASLLILLRLNARRHNLPHRSRQWPIAASFAGLVFHLIALIYTTFTTNGIDFGIFNIASVVSWTICTILLLICLKNTLDHLGIVVLPLAIVTLIFKMLYPESHHLANHSWELKAHVTLSLLAYSIISLAAVQAMLFAVQNHHLHNRKPAGFIRVLPPLNKMESLLFQLIVIGFITLTLALGSGFLFLEDLFAQHVAHKTILSLIAWGGFGILLWGRYRYGWRGKRATRWTLAGAALLMLAYFGSKMVLEWILPH